MAESFALPLHEDPGRQSHRRSHSPVRCRDLGSLKKTDLLERFHQMLAFHPWHQIYVSNEEVLKRASLSSIESCVGLATSQRWKTYACPKHFPSASTKKGSVIVAAQKVLQRPAEKTSCTGGNQPSVMAARGLRPRQQALISEKSQS